MNASAPSVVATYAAAALLLALLPVVATGATETIRIVIDPGVDRAAGGQRRSYLSLCPTSTAPT